MWFFCRREHLREPGKRQSSLEEHFVWMKAQHDAGSIVMSGPSPDLKYGMYLIRARTYEEAERIAASDPYTVAGDSRFVLFEWDVRQIAGVGAFSAAGVGLANRGL
jgi:uncharacterized protein YciI